MSHPGFDPITLDAYDVYIVIIMVRAKGQGPTIDWLCYVLDLKLSPMVYRGMRNILCFSSCKYASIIN